MPIVVRSGGRCDSHARGQSTQTVLFRVFVRLDDGDEVARLLVPTKSKQMRLLGFLDRACAGS